MGFIVVKLLNKFVSDEISLETYRTRSAPLALLDLMDEAIDAWFSTPRPGHLRTVLRTILDPIDQSSFFWSPRAMGAKVKTPLEFINSSYRALSARIVEGPLTERMEDMGMDLFRRDDPDGYPELGFEWMDTHNLLERLRFCQDLALNGELASGRWSIDRLIAQYRLRSAEDIIEHFNQTLFQGRLPERRKQVFLDFANTDDRGQSDPVEALRGPDRMTRLRQLAGIILSTQEFQFQ